MWYEILPHTADLKIRVRGESKKELFSNSLRAMFMAMRPKAADCAWEAVGGADTLKCAELGIVRQIKLKSVDEKALLVDFLSEALALSDANNEAYLGAEIVNLSETEIEARILGLPVSSFEEEEIKAVTHHGIEIKKTKDGFETEIIFDV
ncbi:archease [Candidatus Uhrbacteria bacterium]|nr:archease [Candidatus Uhrbacteria bacterium]